MKKVVVVTGAASGIGLSTALLLSVNYHVIATYRSTPVPEDAINKLSGQIFKCDVANFEDCRKLASFAAEKGQVFGFVHCAALNPTPAPSVEEMEPAFWDKILHNNLTSCFYLAKAFIPVTSSPGSFVFVSSTAGRNGFSLAGGAPGHAKTAYATSKAAIIAFTKGLAKELASRNIRVNCMAAGPIDTRMLPNREETAKRVPLGRIGLPEEAAIAIDFLLGQATYTTGCTLDVCGGQYMN